MDQLLAKGRSLGLNAIAITHSEPFTRAKREIAKLQKNNLYPDFVEQDINRRTNPSSLLPTVKSIISVAIAYKTVQPRIRPGSGLLSRYAWGEDYHRVLPTKLEKLAEWVQQHLGVSDYLIAVDTQPTIDRAIFLRAGLGWLGKNRCVYLPNYGSWVFLGSILVDKELPITYSDPMIPPCHDCEECVRACPTNALFEPYKINPSICISYLTQMKGYTPIKWRSKIGVRLWGCDICQEVCPVNKRALSGTYPGFLPLEATSIPVIPLLNISNRDFNQRFRATALGWRGKGVLQRNAAIVCGNLRLTEALSELEISIKDPKPVIRATTAWALAKIGTKKARKILANHGTKETNSKVLEEIKQALEN